MHEIVFVIFTQIGAATTGPLYTENVIPFEGPLEDCLVAAIELSHKHPTDYATCLDLAVFSGGEPA